MDFSGTWCWACVRRSRSLPRGSAGFNQQRHLPHSRVIGTQWTPLSNAPLHLCHPPPLRHPSSQHGAICIYIVSLAHRAVGRHIRVLYTHTSTNTCNSQCVDISPYTGIIFIVLAVAPIGYDNIRSMSAAAFSPWGKKYEQSDDFRQEAEPIF